MLSCCTLFQGALGAKSYGESEASQSMLLFILKNLVCTDFRWSYSIIQWIFCGQIYLCAVGKFICNQLRLRLRLGPAFFNRINKKYFGLGKFYLKFCMDLLPQYRDVVLALRRGDLWLLRLALQEHEDRCSAFKS